MEFKQENRTKPGGFLRFFQTTLAGGILFLLPAIVIAIILIKAHQAAAKVMLPLAGLISKETIAGMDVARLLALALLIFCCFFAGLFARTSLAQKLVRGIENAVLSNLPGYSFIKGIGESVAGVETDRHYEPVLVSIEEAWQIGFLMERIEGGHAAIYVPDAPSPWSGSVYFMPEERFKMLDIPPVSLLACLRKLGTGSERLLGGKL
jgi:uncharacterized membrane protein